MKWDDELLFGLKFETDEMEYCLDVTWNTYNTRGAWKYLDIENNKQIVGIAAYTEGPDSVDYIGKLGFILATEENWVPKPPQAPTSLADNKMIFGEGESWERQWPKSDDDLKKCTGPAKLKAIRYKCYSDDDSICAIQLIFTTFKTPMIECGSADGYEIKTITVDPEHPRIASISMNTYRDDEFYGIRMLDENENTIIDHKFTTRYNSDKWVTKEIPDEEQLVGVAATCGNRYINRLGFITGTPC